jgi:hypothetical protein
VLYGGGRTTCTGTRSTGRDLTLVRCCTAGGQREPPDLSIHLDGTVKYLPCSAEQASAQSPVPPGGMLTLSANGSQPHSGVVWAQIPYTGANTQVSAGRLLAYNATVSTLSRTDRSSWAFCGTPRTGTFLRLQQFNLPVVANGRVIGPTYQARVDVYGL